MFFLRFLGRFFLFTGSAVGDRKQWEMGTWEYHEKKVPGHSKTTGHWQKHLVKFIFVTKAITIFKGGTVERK